MKDFLVFVSRSASTSGGGRGVCRLHVELEGERLPDSAGVAVSGHEQPVHQGNTSVCFFFNTFMKFSLSSSSSDAISDIHQHEIIAKLSTQ